MDSFGNFEHSALVNKFIKLIDNNIPCYFDSEDMEDIIEELMNALNFQYLSLAIDHAIAQFPSESLFRFYRVKKYILEFQMENAEKELDEIERSFPPSADLYIEKVFLSNMTNKKTEKTIKWLNKALALEPNDPDIHFLMGHEYVRKNDILTAIKHVSLALQSDPIFGENLFTYSYLFEELNKPEEAVEFFTILTEEFPLLGAAWFALGFTLSWSSRFEEAIEAYSFALTCDGDIASAHFNMANAYFELKDYDKALHHYFEAYNLDQEDFQALTNIGDCYAIQKWFDESLEYYYKAYEISPTHNEAVLGIVNALFELGKVSEARVFVQNAFEKYPQNIDLLFAVVTFFEEQDATFFYKLAELTLNHLENSDHFFFFITQFCIYNKMYEVGINVIEVFLKSEHVNDDEKRSKMYYYLAALYYLNENSMMGNTCLSEALLINYNWHKNFMEFSPLLETYPEILKLIELYA
ncbi:MAG: tetratricopeptide repeat protein [Bacteroidetes bacterium]|nr:tetratricopeptide repeat protein [Bacteroidota bacterium]MCL1969327.1 tetratricopeptide repeat protein [Bacteroidota bacterium]MCL1969534.1 tetratricopeptide repeat protein [Bacteroidota bacterium]